MKVLEDIYVPKEGVSDEFVTVVKLYVKDGDKVKKGDVLADLETSKTVVSIESQSEGYVKLFCKEGEDIKINSLIVQIVDSLETQTKQNIDNKISDKEVSTLFSKKALKLIEENKIPKEKFASEDFVNEYDVLKIINPNIDKEDKKIATKKESFTNNIKVDEQIFDVEPLSNYKKREIEYLSDIQKGDLNSVLNIAVSTENIDKTVKDSFEIFEGSYLPLIVYEVSRLLKKYKILNSCFLGDKIGYYKHINLGMAIDMDDGLKVLTLKDSDTLDMKSTEKKLYELIEKYLDKKLEIDDITGSTFTITDLSSYGVDFFTPLINAKQSAILGVSKVDEKLDRFYLTLVFDHRVTEGKTAGNFLQELKDRVESYYLQANTSEQIADKDIKCYKCYKTLEEDKELDGPGFVKIVDHKGNEKYICQVCLRGL